jgi:tripartite-type tricarboxylate transporter receptor subunit TctC
MRRPINWEETMFHMMKAVLRNAAVLAVAVGSVSLAGVGPAAAEWPERPVTIVVPYGPGAVNDLYARFIAQKLGEKFGSPFVVDNRPGGGNGAIGTTHVQRADPDGYTFLEHQNIIATLGQGGSTITFNAGTDVTPVALIAEAPEALLVPTAIDVDTPQELSEFIHANPDKAFYGIGGLGSERHMLTEKFVKMIDAPMKAVPFSNGGADVMTALATSRIVLQISSPATAQAMIDAGKVKVLAYLGEGASQYAPQAPTLKSLGVDLESHAWWGIFAPNGTPADIVEKMNQAINEITASAEFVEMAARAGASVRAITPSEFGDVVKTEVQRVIDLSIETGITAQ